MDRKGRVVMPALFRSILGVPFILTRAPGNCLLVLSGPQWETLCRKYEESILFRGYYLAAAVECPVDENTGRFLIPHVLREYAGLRAMDEVAIVGIGRAVLVSRRDRWEDYVRSGEFPSLGALDRELEVPRRAETEPFRQTVLWRLGIPVIQCRGGMRNKRSVNQVASGVMEVLERQPPVVVLDLRETGDTQPAMSLIHTLTRAPRLAAGVPLWVVSDTQLPGDQNVRGFRNLEEVFLNLDGGASAVPLPAAESSVATLTRTSKRV